MQTSAYIKSPAGNAEKVIEFLVQILEFEVINNEYSAGDEKGIVLNNRYGNTLVIKQEEGVQPTRPVVINTADCLKSCFESSAHGLQTINRPYYTNEGLAAEVLDQFGNHYILVEKRSLIES